MAGLEQVKPHTEELIKYIDNYIQFYHEEDGSRFFKNVLPCTGISVIFNYAPMLFNELPASDIQIIGLHDNLHRIQSSNGKVDSIVIRFLPIGLSRFINKPVSDLSWKVSDGISVFGPSIMDLYHAIRKESDFSQRALLIDEFFLKRLKAPDNVDTWIAQAAEEFRKEPGPVSLHDMNRKNQLPLSTRQMARRFKNAIGVNLQTYIRICRFEIAKSLFFKEQDHTLTSIGYLSGYYDQAHFSKEFKKLSGLNAKDFMPSCSLQKMLYLKQKKLSFQ